jgi:HEAT repeat protein
MGVPTVLQAQDSAVAKPEKKEKGSKRAKPVEATTVKAPPKMTASELDKLSADLVDEDDQKVINGATRLAEVGGDEALERILEVLAAGTYPRVAPDLLDAVGKFKNPKSLQILVMYSGNLNFRVRSAAVKAIAALSEPRVVEILLERLGDPHPEVRTIAAEALAERKEARSVNRLFLLFKRNDAGAAGPLGRLADLDMAPKIAELRGAVTDANLAVALGELLKRPGAPDRLRLDIVRTIGRIPGADATTALVEFVGSLDPKDNSPSHGEAQTLIDQRGDL